MSNQDPSPSQKRTRTVGSFFNLLELHASEIDRFADTFQRIREGDLHGAIISGLYPAHVLEEVVARLERHDPPFVKTYFPEVFRASFYGENLNLTTNLEQYFAKVPTFEKQLASLFPPGLGIADHIAGIMARLDGNRPFVAPPGPWPGHQYMGTTIRCHLPGGFIPAHLDNEQALRASYAHLRTICQPQMLSFVLALSQPVGGGALEVFNFRQDTLTSVPLNSDKYRHLIPDTSTLECARFRLAPGSMIIVDSGRYLHGVSPVQGDRNRWTVCSFMALANDASAMYMWG